MVLTPDALVLVQDSLAPNAPQRRSCSKNWGLVERVAAVVVRGRLADIAGGGTLHFGEVHIADVEDTADDSHCSSDSEEPGTAAAIAQPWRVDRTYKWCIKLIIIDKCRFQKRLVVVELFRSGLIIHRLKYAQRLSRTLRQVDESRTPNTDLNKETRMKTDLRWP